MKPRTQLLFSAVFSCILAVTLVFFVVVRHEFPTAYARTFIWAANLLSTLGLPVTEGTIEGLGVLAGFVATTLFSAILLRWGLSNI